MAKRKVGVKDIIYELDNEDLSGNSDDGVINLNTKIRKNRIENLTDQVHSLSQNENSNARFTNISSHIGGKRDRNSSTSSSRNERKGAKFKNETIRGHDKTIIISENMATDSSTCYSNNCVQRAENLRPLIYLKFRDKTVAKKYKHKIKTFILDAIKKHKNESSTIDSDTDIELEIWPEDFDKNEKEMPPVLDDNLFFIDTDPCSHNKDVPIYKQALNLISNNLEEEKKSETQVTRSRFSCFNCDGEHQLKDCKVPRNHARIAEKRRNFGVKVGRYHVEDDQKYGHLIPGRISGQLRYALGIKRYELPHHIYRMRLLGYPCGWMEEARILPSGINMFDSSGNQILDPGEEDGEILESGSKDLYDIKKIHDFPGFNVPASSMYLEESHLFGLPQMSEKDSKILMLQRLAPNAMKAYKRKKLKLFPSSVNDAQEGQAEMDLESGDDTLEFPSVPPLPDEEPPMPEAPPPPPPETPPTPKLPNQTTLTVKPRIHEILDTKNAEHPPETSRSCNSTATTKQSNSKKSSMNDTEIVEVIQFPDSPLNLDDFITIDDDDDDISIPINRGKNSPSINDLEDKKRLLLDAIKSADTGNDSGTDTDISKDIIFDDKTQSTAGESIESIAEYVLLESDIEENSSFKKECFQSTDEVQVLSDDESTSKTVGAETSTPESSISIIKIEKVESIAESVMSESDIEENNRTKKGWDESKNELQASSVTPTCTMADKDSAAESISSICTPGKVKDSLFGAPVINMASPFNKLPSDDKFAKDICDVIYYENLPNSIGKYKKISSLLKKVKCEVDKIQDS